MKIHTHHDVANTGTIEQVRYDTAGADGTVFRKCANVYVPYGYDTANRYNVLYLIHGGGGDENAWLKECDIQNALDCLIEEGLAAPFLVVFPCFYRERTPRGGPVDEGAERGAVLGFQRELRQDLIPLIDEKYSTVSSREGRAIGGFSMGGVTTWFAFLENLDLISAFMPLSGDCWYYGGLGGGKYTEETAQYLYETTKAGPFGKDDFRIFAGTGSKDIAYPNLTPQIEAMKKYTDLFEFSDAPEEGNFHYVVTEGAEHTYTAVYQHVYNFAPYLVKLT